MTEMSIGPFLNLIRFEPEAWLNQLREIDRLAGIGHIEVWLEWLPSDKIEYSAVRSVLSGRRLLIHAPFIGLSIASPWHELRSISITRIIECCEIARTLDAELVTIHPGPVPVYEDVVSTLDIVAASYEQIRHAAGTVEVALENTYSGHGVSVNAAAKISDLLHLSSIVSDLRLTLDVGHAIQNQEEYIEFLNSNVSMISNIHLHDATVGGRAHMRLGDGSLDLSGLLNACVSNSYKHFIGLETLTLDDARSSLQMVRQHLNGINHDVEEHGP